MKDETSILDVKIVGELPSGMASYSRITETYFTVLYYIFGTLRVFGGSSSSISRSSGGGCGCGSSSSSKQRNLVSLKLSKLNFN
jgi:hypothetical protein